LEQIDISGYDDVLVSCEYGTAKTQNLFSVLQDKYPGKKILHIGDDEYADIEKAKSHNIDTFRLYSATDLFDLLGGLGLENEIDDIADRVKIGLILSRVFNDPFWFEDDRCKLSVNDASDIGYLFCAPMITDFVHWMKDKTKIQGYEQILFGARDGYLMDQLYKMIDVSRASFYFLTSRTAAIRTGMESQEDVDYVDSMKYFGTPEETLRVRFGIEVDDVNTIDRGAAILDKA